MDPRAQELINLELDHRLDDAGRAELAARVAADPALAAHRDQLYRVERTLAAAPAPEMPEGFRDAVLRQVRLPQRSTARAFPSRRHWRGGLALAASIVAAVIVLRVVDSGPVFAPDQISGTLAPAVPTLTARPSAGGLSLSFDIPAGPPGEIVIEFTEGGRRIVVPGVGPGNTTLQVAGNAGDLASLKATLTRNGVAIPIARRNR